jgi:RecA/RadA recombinase
MSKDVYDILKLLDNENASVASDGMYSDTHGYIDTGSYTLNALFSGDIYGGVPNNTITALAGEESTGKCMDGDELIEVYVLEE